MVTPGCTSQYDSPRSLLGEEDILGYRTLHYWIAPKSGPDGSSIERHVWLAPDLGCYELMNTVYRYVNGKIAVVFDKTPGTVVAGEPDPTLFAVPVTYNEVKPSELMTSIQRQRVLERDGYSAAEQFTVPAGIVKRWTRLDEDYDKVNTLKK